VSPTSLYRTHPGIIAFYTASAAIREVLHRARPLDEDASLISVLTGYAARRVRTDDSRARLSTFLSGEYPNLFSEESTADSLLRQVDALATMKARNDFFRE
jgi:hypothetical protein